MIRRAIAIAVLLLGGTALAQVRPAAPTNRAVVTIGVNNGVNAWWIGNVNFYAPPSADPKEIELRDALAGFRDASLANSSNLLEGETPAYIFLTDGFGTPAGRFKSLIVFALERDDFDDSMPAVCDVNDDWALGGFSVTTGLDGRASMTMLGTGAKGVLAPLCTGLAKPISSLTGSTPGAGTPAVIDLLLRDKSAMTMILVPGNQNDVPFEAAVGRYFWVPALAARYSRMPQGSDIVERPENFEALSNVMNGREGAFNMAPLPFPLRGRGFDAYPAAAKAEFAGLERLDNAWTAFLARAGLTVRGRSISLLEGAPAAARLHRFTIAELGTPDFWRSSNDVANVMEFSACIGGRFLIAQGYRPRDLEGSLGRCATSEIKPPA